MKAKRLECPLRNNSLVVQTKNICVNILPYVLCALLLLTSSCLLRFDRDGSHDRHDGHDHDQHHDEERYDRNNERDRHGMNLKQEQYARSEISGQAEGKSIGKPDEVRGA